MTLLPGRNFEAAGFRTFDLPADEEPLVDFTRARDDDFHEQGFRLTSDASLYVFALGEGDHGRAVSYLEQAYASDSQWLGWLGGDRIFDPLRSDARFVALLTKIGLAS